MSFARGFTPTFILTIPSGSEDLTAVDNITVDISGVGKHVVKTGESVAVTSATELEVSLSQEDTLAIAGSTVSIQVNWTYPGGSDRWGTNIATVSVDKQLHMEVIG